MSSRKSVKSDPFMGGCLLAIGVVLAIFVSMALLPYILPVLIMAGVILVIAVGMTS